MKQVKNFSEYMSELKKLAIKRYETDIKEEMDDKFVKNKDLTNIFHKEIHKGITKRREVQRICILGPPRTGKSTIEWYLVALMLQIKNKHLGRNPKKWKMGTEYICRDQYEFIRKMTDPNTVQIPLGIDEWNKMEETGANSTTLSALMNTFNEVQAGRYIDCVWCSITETPDTTAEIILEVQAKDPKNKIVNCLLYYNLYRDAYTRKILIGHVNIPVGHVIKNWLEFESEEGLRKARKNKEKKKELEKLRRKDGYVDYQYKKFQKMELMNEEGIFRTRLLDYAPVIDNVVKKMKPLIEAGVLKESHKAEIISTLLKKEVREKKIATSMVGDAVLVKEVRGMLHPYEALRRLRKEQIRIRAEKNKKPGRRRMNNKEIAMKLKAIKGTAEAIKDIIDEGEREIEMLKKVNKKYNEVVK